MCEFGRRLARLEDFFFRLILEFCILIRSKIVFSGNDAKFSPISAPTIIEKLEKNGFIDGLYK